MSRKSFINPHIKPSKRGFKDFLLWRVGYFDEEKDDAKGHVDFSFPACSRKFDPQLPSATWINHSTFLVRAEGMNILTDPIFSKRCSPLPVLGPKRSHPPGIPLSELPRIDIVLLSHDHYDHLDKRTVLELMRLNPQIIWFVPVGVKKWFDQQGIAPVYELGWWDDREFSLPSRPNVRAKLTAVPAQHFSGRKGFDINSSLWLGWVFEFTHSSGSLKRFYFVGDTGYNPFDFKKIREKFDSFDLCMIPIGAYEPKAFMGPVHVNPEEAVRIHQEVGSRFSVAMHWKTFRLSDEPMERPPYDLYQALIKEKIDPAEFIVVEPGHAFNW